MCLRLFSMLLAFSSTNGLQQFVTNNKVYVSSFNFLEYKDASKYCQALGGYLPRPMSEHELQNIGLEWQLIVDTVLSLKYGHFNYYFLDAKSENNKEFFYSNGKRCPLQDSEIWNISPIITDEDCKIITTEYEGMAIQRCRMHGRVLCEIRTRNQASLDPDRERYICFKSWNYFTEEYFTTHASYACDYISDCPNGEDEAECSFAFVGGAWFHEGWQSPLVYMANGTVIQQYWSPFFKPTYQGCYGVFTANEDAVSKNIKWFINFEDNRWQPNSFGSRYQLWDANFLGTNLDGNLELVILDLSSIPHRFRLGYTEFDTPGRGSYDFELICEGSRNIPKHDISLEHFCTFTEPDFCIFSETQNFEHGKNIIWRSIADGPSLDHTTWSPSNYVILRSGYGYLKAVSPSSICVSMWVYTSSWSNSMYINGHQIKFNTTAGNNNWQIIKHSLDDKSFISIEANVTHGHYIAIDDVYFIPNCGEPFSEDSKILSQRNIIITVSAGLSAILIILIGLSIKSWYRKRTNSEISAYLEHMEFFMSMDYDDEAKSKWELDNSKLIRGDLIGNGHCGLVFKSKYKINGASCKTVAEKVVTRKRNVNEVNSLFNELKVLMEIGTHINVLKLEGAVTSKVSLGELKIVTEYCEFGSLNNYLSTCSEALLIPFCYQIALGMEYISQKGYIHRDLAARNVLVTSNNILKICDFGSAVLENECSGTQLVEVNPWWMEPEAKLEIWSTKSDVYSYGVVMWEIFTKGDPATEMKTKGSLGRPGNELCNDGIFAIIKKSWNEHPESRPSFVDIVALLKDYVSDDLQSDYHTMNDALEIDETSSASGDYYQDQTCFEMQNMQ